VGVHVPQSFRCHLEFDPGNRERFGCKLGPKQLVCVSRGGVPHLAILPVPCGIRPGTKLLLSCCWQPCDTQASTIPLHSAQCQSRPLDPSQSRPTSPASPWPACGAAPSDVPPSPSRSPRDHATIAARIPLVLSTTPVVGFSQPTCQEIVVPPVAPNSVFSPARLRAGLRFGAKWPRAAVIRISFGSSCSQFGRELCKCGTPPKCTRCGPCLLLLRSCSADALASVYLLTISCSTSSTMLLPLCSFLIATAATDLTST
jgi:hypothetical protein